ncbi:DNA mismatch endonuclease Vsr [Pelagicoccus sp. SDUM812003]|uniref:very short patch repair endonuclease n=1 Tax=Pelagicoccus sp. SDUM812003 TaxID=3041267 RepID=UPI00280C4B05|nr:DNA mismatch endonuclease Vsr [Pelagicoccus sp. SDUM812003]MDQ8202437.1 DNA mismatch endonuclease Vsr [Pelagicoccus sp. SDUM812003]
MPDKISKLHRSWIMSRVAGRNTKPERLVRSLLHRIGYRFTVNGPKNKKLPGRPDIVLPARKTVIFVHGCFWHRHAGCKHATTPKSNTAYWQAKFRRNVERDRETMQALQRLGWRCMVIWECELKDIEAMTARLVSELPRADGLELPDTLDDQQLVAETQALYGKR